MNKCAKFHKDSPSDKKLNSISRERLNFRRWPILCTTLYRNLMQASNFRRHIWPIFLWFFFLKFSQKMFLYFFYTMVQKSQKWPKTQIKGVLKQGRLSHKPGSFLASAPLHTQDTEIGLGALVWQPQPSFSISDRSCLMAEKSRQNASRIARQKMKTGCERHGERESERRREDSRPSLAEQERQSDATNVNSKTWCERSRQDKAVP